MDRLHKIAELFPGEKRKTRVCESVPDGELLAARRARQKDSRGAEAGHQSACRGSAKTSPAKTGTYNADTLRDLAKISESIRKYSATDTRAMLNTAVNEIGEYLRASRTLAVIAPRRRRSGAEYCGPNMKPAPGAQVVSAGAGGKSGRRRTWRIGRRECACSVLEIWHCALRWA